MNSKILDIDLSEKLSNLPLDKCLSLKEHSVDIHCPYALFSYFFECIPQIETISNMNCSKVLAWMRKKYNYQIFTQFYSRFSSGDYTDFYYENFNIVLNDGVLIHLNFCSAYVRVFYKGSLLSYVKEIWEGMCECSTRKGKSAAKISIIINDDGYLTTKTLPLKPSKVDLDLHYNSDFKKVHALIKENLNAKNQHGLLLLHGLPGTGKTNYLRFLLTEINKDVIFFPVHFAENLTHSSILSF